MRFVWKELDFLAFIIVPEKLIYISLNALEF